MVSFQSRVKEQISSGLTGSHFHGWGRSIVKSKGEQKPSQSTAGASQGASVPWTPGTDRKRGTRNPTLDSSQDQDCNFPKEWMFLVCRDLSHLWAVIQRILEGLLRPVPWSPPQAFIYLWKSSHAGVKSTCSIYKPWLRNFPESPPHRTKSMH